MAEVITNRVETNDVRRETLRGREYLIAPVTAARAQMLNGGYVPAEEWQQSQVDWNRVPLPVGHPMNERGEYITARLPEVVEHAAVGDFYRAHYDDETESLNGELWVDVEQAESLGDYGEQIIGHLESGEPLEVSTAYRAEEGSPGEYDGQHYEEVRVNLRPDHLALLPGDLGPGKCSVEDGCGTTEVPPAGKAANSDEPDAASATADEPAMAGYCVGGDTGEMATNVYLNMARNILSQARTPEYTGTTAGEWSAPTLSNYLSAYDMEADQVEDLTQEEKSTIASHTLLGEASADSFDELQAFPVVEPGGQDLSENALDAVIGGRGSQADYPDESIESAQTRARSLLEDEFDRDFGNTQADSDGDSDADSDADSESDSDDADADANAEDADSSSADEETTESADEPDTESDAAPDPDDSGGDASDGDSDPASAASEPTDGDESTTTNDGGADSTTANCPSSEEQEAVTLLQRAFSLLGLDTDGSESATEANADDGDATGDGSGATDANGVDDSQEAADSDPDSDADDDDESASTAADSTADTSASDQSTTSTTTDMSDYDLEHIAAQTGFSEEELRKLSDEKLSNLAEMANAPDDGASGDDTDTGADADDAGGDGTDADDAGDGTSSDDTDDGGDTNTDDGGGGSDGGGSSVENVDQEELDALVEQRVESMLNDEDTVESLLDDHLPEGIEAAAQTHVEEREERRERLKNQILSNSEQYDEEMLDNMDDPTLRATAAQVKPASGTDYGARPTAAANASSNDSDGPSTAGTMRDWKEAQE